VTRSLWTFRRVLTGHEINGELSTLPEPLRSMAEYLARVTVDENLTGQARREALAAARDPLWKAMMAACPDRETLTTSLAAVDPDAPAPEAEPSERCATLADVRRLVNDTVFPWKGWLAAGVLNALAADPGTGKTIMAADLARRLWHKVDWPDGQPNTLPEGTRTLWVPGDRHYIQLTDLARDYGLPDEAILFNASVADPTAGLDLDDPDELAALDRRIRSERPGLVIVDTVGMTTARNLCRPEDARAYFGPLMDLAQQTRVPFLLLTHLSKDAQALGRRIVGACRLVWKMTQPDPEGQPDRRRVWVDKSYTVKPQALGMTISAAGCSFDSNPPTAPQPDKGGRPPEARDKARKFIVDALTRENDRKATAVLSEWVNAGGRESTFWNARDDMVKAGELVCDGKPKIMHLIREDRDDDQPF
jgi:hypothetical protein